MERVSAALTSLFMVVLVQASLVSAGDAHAGTQKRTDNPWLAPSELMPSENPEWIKKVKVGEFVVFKAADKECRLEVKTADKEQIVILETWSGSEAKEIKYELKSFKAAAYMRPNRTARGTHKLAGKDVACDAVDYSILSNEGSAVIRNYVSTQIPLGGLLKKQSSKDGGKNFETTLELTDFGTSAAKKP